MKLENKAQTNFEAALRTCPAAGSGVHSWVMACANLAAFAAVPPMEAETAILQAMTTRAPNPRSEVGAAIRKAYAEHTPGGVGKGYTPRNIAPAKPKPLPMTAQKFIQRGDGAGESDWWEASPIRIGGEPGYHDAIALLGALYAPGEFVFCGERYGGGENVRTVADWIRRFEYGIHIPPHIIPNPLCGREVPNPKENGKPSARCDEAIARFKFATAEFDNGLTKPEQLAFWWGFRTAPIVALIDTGGKSIHAWLRVDCPSRAEWTADIRGKLFGRVLIPLGTDPSCANESRLSRLPGHFRREKNQWQRLLYLNPLGTPRQ